MRQRYRPDDHKLLVRFKRACVGLVHARQLPAVRGWEGWASRHYWRWFAQQVNQLGGFEERRTHGQTQDPVNLALNYGYALLRHRLGVAVRLAGLDPYLGVLHEANGRHEALVSDLVEIFRPEVDRLVIRLIHLKMIQPKDFVFQDGLLWLRPEARRRFVQSFTRICEGLPRHGGSMLHSRIRRLVDSYKKAVLEGTLSDWRPIPQGWTKEVGGDFPP
ncbi:CRISPR-associated endonuclease Cas1 [Candidatus Methylacidiphilum infernorum]|uniref:CRISPR-associated protein Cas1 n=1 Tax=Methylacidiphilum infernorum (isolate V4) TaxID=481448 RepID=B3E1C9_METI4|nr:CRISPR-associated endonuclease Cas1 [Candidatus Methylacidiphilum infernorum]ACD82925.1 CRISPR-associated protein Cas1 [Methylacidiphilum infernorum V4]